MAAESSKEHRDENPPDASSDAAEKDPSRVSEADSTWSGISKIADIPDLPELGSRRHGPREIGPYRIVSTLGEGGMGTVYLAEQEEPVRRRVAIKLMKPGMDSQEVLARFRAEEQALALMQHPSIAGEFEVGTTEDGLPYFVMEHVPGLPVNQYCDAHKLPTEERLQLFLKVCDAVQHAHHKGIIHRDIKPSNVLVMDVDGKALPKVIDFGIAKALGENLSGMTLCTEAGAIIGTPEYMSPEQAEGTSADVDTRTDIYSLGVVLYELMVGTLPFDAHTLRESGLLSIQRTILETDPVRPSTRLRTMSDEERALVIEARDTDYHALLRRVRGDLDWIVLKCLEKDRDRRYAAISELAADIKRHLHHEPVLARAPSVLYRARKFARKRRVPLAFAAGTLVILLVAAGIAHYRSVDRFRRGVEVAVRALQAEDLEGVRHTLGFLESSHPGHARVVGLREEANELARELQVRESRNLAEIGEGHFGEFLRVKESRDELESSWKDAVRDLEPWQPVWERSKELEAWDRLSRIDELLSEEYNDAVIHLLKALDAAPEGSDQRRAVQAALERVYWDRYEEAWRRGSISLPASYFKSLVDSLGLGTYQKELSETILLETDPPGADVYCFRYVDQEERLVPVPCGASVESSRREIPPGAHRALVVEHVFDPDLCPFVAGDRIVRVAGKDILSRTDLASALSEVRAEETVGVSLIRGGEEHEVEWTPFPAERYQGLGAESENPLRPGRLLDIYVQLGCTFEAYRVEYGPKALLGRTRATGPLTIDLPRGSYLFVFKRHGYATARLPLVVPGEDTHVRVRLLEPDDIPTGFVYVPEGSFSFGGDPQSYNGLEQGTARVEGFLIARTEVTFAQYVEFLNAMEADGRIDETGNVTPLADWSSEDYRPFVSAALRKSNRLPVLPVDHRGRVYVEKREGVWQSQVPDDWPVFGVSLLVGLDYTHWLTRKHGGRWRFRLPRDLEWERAARGVDRRTFVWGNYLLWSVCRTQRGSYPGRPNSTVDRVRIHPIDESVFEVRDLAGSMKEPVLEVEPDSRLAIVRGGEWSTVDPRDFRVATRNRRRPEGTFTFVGLRIVAELPDGDSGG